MMPKNKTCGCGFPILLNQNMSDDWDKATQNLCNICKAGATFLTWYDQNYKDDLVAAVDNLRMLTTNRVTSSYMLASKQVLDSLSTLAGLCIELNDILAESLRNLNRKLE